MNRRRNPALILSIMVIGILVILAGLTVVNYRFAKESPGGNDFLVHWMGTRSFLTDGLSPYSDEVALRIQNMVYGRPAKADEHQLRVAYPLYSVLLFMPFAFIPDFTLARALWMTLLEAGLLGSVWLCIRLVRWRIGPITLALLFLFSIFWYHGLRTIVNGNAVILVLLGITGGLLAIRNGQDELAGILLAFTTIKPQVVLVVLLWVAIWALLNKRYRIVVWMVGTTLLLAGIAALLLPDWIVQNIREIINYPGYNPPGTPAAALAELYPGLGRQLGLIVSGISALLLLLEWWLHRRSDQNSFIWTACLTLTASQWIGIQTDPGNFIVCLPALALIFAAAEDRWKKKGNAFTILSMVGLFAGIWAIFLNTVTYSYQPVQSPIMFFPLPVFLWVGLYWMRWWSLKRGGTWADLSSF